MLTWTSRHQPETGRLTLEVVGELDLATRHDLERAILEQIERGVSHLSLDLSRVKYLGSVGLAVLINSAKTLKRRGGELKITTDSPEAIRHLKLLNLDSLLLESDSKGDSCGTL